MSKLDDVITFVQDETTARDEAKQYIKALFLELIGEDNRFISDVPSIDEVVREEVRAELRQKVNEL